MLIIVDYGAMMGSILRSSCSPPSSLCVLWAPGGTHMEPHKDMCAAGNVFSAEAHKM